MQNTRINYCIIYWLLPINKYIMYLNDFLSQLGCVKYCKLIQLFSSQCIKIYLFEIRFFILLFLTM